MIDISIVLQLTQVCSDRLWLTFVSLPSALRYTYSPVLPSTRCGFIFKSLINDTLWALGFISLFLCAGVTASLWWPGLTRWDRLLCMSLFAIAASQKQYSLSPIPAPLSSICMNSCNSVQFLFPLFIFSSAFVDSEVEIKQEMKKTFHYFLCVL